MALDVGAPLSKATVNAQVGAAAQSFKRGLDELVAAYEWQQAYTAENLETIGFTTEEATLLKSALGEVPAIDDAVGATSFLKRLWGVGHLTVDAVEVDALVRPENGRPGEPEKLVLPAAGVRDLLEVALRTEPGAALWRGFVIAHGEPSWLLARPGEPRTWALRAQDAEVVPVARE